MDFYNYYAALVVVQLLHSQEEIRTGIYKRWFVFTMPRWMFIAFEVVFSALILAYLIKPDLPASNVIMPVFALLMLVNGVGHIVWGLIERQYVPGLITAPLFIMIFSLYYLQLTGVI